jgi:hypothetical protein
LDPREKDLLDGYKHQASKYAVQMVRPGMVVGLDLAALPSTPFA